MIGESLVQHDPRNECLGQSVGNLLLELHQRHPGPQPGIKGADMCGAIDREDERIGALVRRHDDRRGCQQPAQRTAMLGQRAEHLVGRVTGGHIVGPDAPVRLAEGMQRLVHAQISGVRGHHRGPHT
jgi:hypothetical protein